MADPHLPNELVISILSRLPIKSLLRCRCVSKQWHSLISLSSKSLPSPLSGFFFKNHTLNTIQFLSLHSRTFIEPNSVDTHLSFLPNSSNLNVLDSRNGLLLLLQTPNSSHLYVCNPATNKYAQIPQPPSESTQFVLIFDHRVSKHYDILSIPSLPIDVEVGDHEVGNQELELELEVFSSMDREWRKIPSFSRSSFMGSHRFALLDGMVHFVDPMTNDTLVIDTKGRVCRRIGCPDEIDGFVSLGQSGGRLHYALATTDELIVWVVEDDEYVLKHRNGLRDIVDKMYGGSLRPHRMIFHPDLDVIFLTMRDKVFAYRLMSAEVEEICDHDGGALFGYSPCFDEDLGL